MRRLHSKDATIRVHLSPSQRALSSRPDSATSAAATTPGLCSRASSGMSASASSARSAARRWAKYSSRTRSTVSSSAAAGGDGRARRRSVYAWPSWSAWGKRRPGGRGCAEAVGTGRMRRTTKTQCKYRMRAVIGSLGRTRSAHGGENTKKRKRGFGSKAGPHRSAERSMRGKSSFVTRKL